MTRLECLVMNSSKQEQVVHSKVVSDQGSVVTKAFTNSSDKVDQVNNHSEKSLRSLRSSFLEVQGEAVGSPSSNR
jgi:hypothetical protein